jgi:uncharacterized protein YacL
LAGSSPHKSEVRFMGVDFIFRLVGMFVFGLGGFYLGQTLVRAGGVSLQDGLVAIIVSILVGGLVGFVLMPFLTTHPYRALQRRIKQTPTTDLLAAVTGLVLGLLIAVLLSFPLSLLPSPLREILPIIAAVVFALLGMSTLISRRRDFARRCSPAVAAALDRASLLDERRCCWTPPSSSTGALTTSAAPGSGAARCWCRALC